MVSLTPAFPDVKAVGQLLRALLDRSVTVELQRTPTVDLPIFLGQYIDNQGRLCFCCGLDLPLAAYVSAALLSFPISRAKENIAVRRLEPIFEENVREVLNVMAQTLNADGAPHLRLDAVVTLQKLQSMRDARFLKVDIANYGFGRIVMSCPQENENNNAL